MWGLGSRDVTRTRSQWLKSCRAALAAQERGREGKCWQTAGSPGISPPNLKSPRSDDLVLLLWLRQQPSQHKQHKQGKGPNYTVQCLLQRDRCCLNLFLIPRQLFSSKLYHVAAPQRPRQCLHKFPRQLPASSKQRSAEKGVRSARKK